MTEKEFWEFYYRSLMKRIKAIELERDSLLQEASALKKMLEKTEVPRLPENKV